MNNLEEPFKSDLEDYEGLATFIFDIVVARYFIHLIKQETQEANKTVKKIARLVEDLVIHENFNVRCIAEVGFIEGLICKMEPTKDVEKYLLPESLKKAREIGHHMFGYDPVTWERYDRYAQEEKASKKKRKKSIFIGKIHLDLIKKVKVSNFYKFLSKLSSREQLQKSNIFTHQ